MKVILRNGLPYDSQLHEGGSVRKEHPPDIENYSMLFSGSENSLCIKFDSQELKA